MTIVFTDDGVCFDINRCHYQTKNGIPNNIIIESDNEETLIKINEYNMTGFFRMHFNEITWKHEAIYGGLYSFELIN